MYRCHNQISLVQVQAVIKFDSEISEDAVYVRFACCKQKILSVPINDSMTGKQTYRSLKFKNAECAGKALKAGMNAVIKTHTNIYQVVQL